MSPERMKTEEFWNPEHIVEHSYIRHLLLLR